MNGDYTIANAPATGSPNTSTFDPFARKFVDVYSPVITSTYGEVVWRGLTPVALPSSFVERFAGKIVSFTGYEANTVTFKNGVEEVGQYRHVYVGRD